MNVKELKKHLEQFDENLEVLYQCHSDYRLLEAEDVEVVEAVEQQFYHMRTHRTMSAESKAKAKDYLIFP
jgi:hypothetical protein